MNASEAQLEAPALDVPLPDESQWPRRLALAALVCCVPLFAFGGSITTLGAGMAVKGWLNAEGHFMLAFPIDKWLRDIGTFVEHTHRQIASAVGLLALLAALVGWRHGGATRWWTLAALFAVAGQGVLGGLRVEQVSPGLAFIHGGVAQGAFVVMALCVLALSKGWRAHAHPVAAPGAFGLTVLSGAAAVAIYGQVWLGAWYRHSLRNFGLGGTDALAVRLYLHLGQGLVAFALVVFLARRLGRVSAELARAGEQPAGHRLGLQRRWLLGLVTLQMLLGFAAWLLQRPDQLVGIEVTLTVSHLLVGALLLAQSAATFLWCRRLLRAPSAAAA